jgi:hypothetical protein
MECELRGMSAKLLGAWLAGKDTGMFTKQHNVASLQTTIIICNTKLVKKTTI